LRNNKEKKKSPEMGGGTRRGGEHEFTEGAYCKKGGLEVVIVHLVLRKGEIRPANNACDVSKLPRKIDGLKQTVKEEINLGSSSE